MSGSVLNTAALKKSHLSDDPFDRSKSSLEFEVVETVEQTANIQSGNLTRK